MADAPNEGQNDRSVLARGFAVLREVNRLRETGAAEIARSVQLPRPTVYRILAELVRLGYVKRSFSDGRFRVGALAQSLGDGFRSDALLCQVAPPILAGLGGTLLWPIDLAVYEDGAMVVQETTHATSPFSLERGIVGRRLPMLLTAAGRAYLGFCSEGERRAILVHLDHCGMLARVGMTRERASRLIAETRRRGYSLRFAEEAYTLKTSSLGLPIIVDQRVLGTLTVIWITSALGLGEAIDTLLGPMQEARMRIEDAVRAERIAPQLRK